MLSPYNITKKSADARFFGPFHKFFLFKKKFQNRKNVRKIAFFPFFPYALRRFFHYFSVIQNAHKYTYYS
jgi:hypothetical protein